MSLIEKSSPRGEHFGSIAGGERMLLLNRKEVDVTLTCDVVGVVIRTDQRAAVLCKRMTADGTDQGFAVEFFFGFLVSSFQTVNFF